jgi:hypothetical protein
MVTNKVKEIEDKIRKIAFPVQTGWKKQVVAPNRILWTKGEFQAGYGYPDWVHVDDNRNATWKNKDDNYEVGGHHKINPKTVNGHFKYYKNKANAIKFAKQYMRTH